MSKIIKLKEADLIKLINRVLKEQDLKGFEAQSGRGEYNPDDLVTLDCRGKKYFLSVLKVGPNKFLADVFHGGDEIGSSKKVGQTEAQFMPGSEHINWKFKNPDPKELPKMFNCVVLSVKKQNLKA